MSINKYYNLAKNTLFPICRSLTGKGITDTLFIIKKEFSSLKIHKISSGKKVFDWVIPPEWNVTEAYVLDKNNKKIIDFKVNNLHLISYSIPINKTVSKKELFKHLYSIPSKPNAIPYITSYYRSHWGFCVTNKEKKFFEKFYKNKDNFKVLIKSNLNKKGNLTYGELTIRGKSKQEILISTYICHPSMANNELSGPIVSMSLINYFLKKKNLNKTIKFIFIPETIGSITYLSQNLSELKLNVIGGYNLSCIGDEKQHSCMFSKYKNSPSDYSLISAYKKLNIKYKEYSFLERGSDERQYNSPGIDLPISSIFRSKYGTYPEYHTSADNFDIVTKKGLAGGFKVALNAVNILLDRIIPQNIILCEPKMDKRNLYNSFSNLAVEKKKNITKHYMDFLQYADGKNDLEIISQKIKINLKLAKKIYLF